MSYIDSARALKTAMDTAGAYLTDAQALTAKAIYSTWTSLIDTAATEGQRFRHGDTIYKVRIAHTFSAEWIPGVETASLYTAIDIEHSGTIDDPIPWVPPMELVNGKYYSDKGVLYLCTRDSGTALAFDLTDLVGTYVEVVNG